MNAIPAEQTEEQRTRIGKRAGMIGIAANILLFSLKLLAGLLAGSVSMLADAVNNMTDAGSSVLLLAGYAVAAMPADKKHPYGHARMEYLSSLFISILVTFLGMQMFWSSAKTLLHPGEAAVYTPLSFVILLGGILVKVGLALYYRAVGKKISSDALRASAADSIGDVCATAAVLLGVLLTPVLGPQADGWVGLLVAVYIFGMGIKLILEACSTILGTPPDGEQVRCILEELRAYPGVLGVHDLVLHSYGEGTVFATAHIEVNADTSVLESHAMLDRMERDCLRNRGIQMVLHADPVQVGNEKLDALRFSVRDILDDVAASCACPLSMHDFRVMPGTKREKLLFDVLVPDDMPLSPEEIVQKIREAIAQKYGETYTVIITVDRDYTATVY